MHKIIDAHAHLEEFTNLPEVLVRARQAGVAAIIAAGTNPRSSVKTLKLSKEYKEPAIYPAIGTHPGDLDEFPDYTETIRLIEQNITAIAAVGEIGLDFWYRQAKRPGPERELQKEAFSAQLDMAAKFGKPVIIHSRAAWRECFDMAAAKGIKKALFHWYSGPEDILKEILDAGYIISAGPSSEYSPEHRRAIEKTPIDKIALETDSPVTYRPKSGTYRSEPKDVVRALRAVAAIKGIEETRLAEQTAKTAKEFFRLA